MTLAAAASQSQPSIARKPSEINGSRPSPLKLSNQSHAIHKPKNKKPLIIYTNSPKIIHTKPHDFMALVQKLTGMSDDCATTSQDPSPATTKQQMDSLFGDIPLFTPNSSADLFCSPRPQPLYRFSSDGLYASPNSLSPSLFDFIKPLPEY